ncbi:type I restriction-modification system subunit M [Mycoplasmopsis pullorum]|uniref:type I restriction-modification system subunit M n=1 Tax=Mycoplasmopsis pullorum TaxID=48003 RepID=UPI00111B93CE|nr:type I restriction-modification system subunit M [Mycoplasmopsis pullorum]TNK82089.1 type I restriction-modification system subunit M [Mycoplasmopsis pullorum]TNK83289.1 type I restriction-modification system subunit M [Mycoplasmopsis pullorum]TNK84389.1 type I restriction-modification system subunit M [Mycoplasmopsis pullorum]TNK85269.1 type I restriction-modification system subunit M [Mycoplasmopsis pullorum]TNK85905.1 type I restriction-modification system subunit M [Mycoplasmopsis pullo
MDNKKELERSELQKTIWNIADKLRGSVDGWDFKNYVLGGMFYRFLSEKITYKINESTKEDDRDFDYALYQGEIDKETIDGITNDLGFFIKPADLFTNVAKNAENNENLNETLERIFRSIEDSARGKASEEDFKGLFQDFDVNNNKLGDTVVKRNKTLTSLLKGIASMNLGNLQDNTIDLFGDAYEYLMGMYASNAGKSGGEYFTPQEVSKLLVKLAIGDKTKIKKIYDMCAGSGSLLLQAVKLLGTENIKNGIYGQEKNVTTYNLCRINMFLHDIPFDKFKIYCDDTLIHPQGDEYAPFDVIVSNPPYSISWNENDDKTLINDPRYQGPGVLAPKSKADWAFILHSLYNLSEDGTAAIVCFPGIMYRGGAEQKIRKYLVENNYVEAVIKLPDNLFFGTSIETCILVLKKNRFDSNVTFIDASSFFVKITKKNKLTEQNIEDILQIYNDKKDVLNYCKVATRQEIEDNDYNLSVNSYVEKEDTREVIDIKKLNAEIKEIVARQAVLRDEIDKIIAELEGEE